MIAVFITIITMHYKYDINIKIATIFYYGSNY